MKTIYTVLLILLLISHGWAANQVSIDEFKKITDPDERRTIIRHAPPEQREELKKIDLHLALLARWGGEEGYKAAKETCIVRARGLGSLEDIFGVEGQIWTGYVSGVLTADDKAGMPPEKRMDVEKKLTEEEDVRSKRFPIIHSLVYSIAASPEALDLDKRAGELGDKLSARISWDGKSPYQPITKEEWTEVGKQVDQIFEEMQKLPKLTPEQVQKEYDAFTDLQMVQNGGGGGPE
jgi:hypothetical protein